MIDTPDIQHPGLNRVDMHFHHWMCKLKELASFLSLYFSSPLVIPSPFYFGVNLLLPHIFFFSVLSFFSLLLVSTCLLFHVLVLDSYPICLLKFDGLLLLDFKFKQDWFCLKKHMQFTSQSFK